MSQPACNVVKKERCIVDKFHISIIAEKLQRGLKNIVSESAQRESALILSDKQRYGRRNEYTIPKNSDFTQVSFSTLYNLPYFQYHFCKVSSEVYFRTPPKEREDYSL